MASLEDLEDLERERDQDKDNKNKKTDADGDAKMDVDGKEDDEIDPEILNGSTTDIIYRRRLLENDLRVMRQEFQRLTHEKANMKERIKDNLDKIENNRLIIFLFYGFRRWGIIIGFHR
jgi:26S proteasome regulatory subunit T5